MLARRRLAAAAALAAMVLLVHLRVGDWAAGHARALRDGTSDAAMKRLQADFIVELLPQQPPQQAPVQPAAQPAPKRPRSARAPSPVASAPAPEPAPEPTPPDDVLASAPAPETTPEPVLPLPPAPEAPASAPPPEVVAQVEAPAEPASASAAVEPASAASAAPAFEWPRSTRLSYRLTGNYRGPVDGEARVEWLLEGTRYQVHVEVAVGPSFAPLVARRMSSDGEVGSDGLQPRRYEEETRVALRDPRRVELRFDDAELRLANGTTLPRPPGVQDTASQFVQLTWLFTTQPQRLRAGESVQLMLALPRRVDPWVYDVLPAETVYTNAGVIEAVPVRPRRLARPRGELSAELWVAPTLQYLPVRIVIRQDEETYVDLLLDRLPQQAASTQR